MTYSNCGFQSVRGGEQIVDPFCARGNLVGSKRRLTGTAGDEDQENESHGSVGAVYFANARRARLRSLMLSAGPARQGAPGRVKRQLTPEPTHSKWLPILGALFFAYQYFTSEKFVNPETGRKSHVAMSAQQEAALGLQTYQQVLSQSETIDSGSELEMVKRVAGRLATATGKSGQDFDWKVSLIRDGKVNAFCLPGGKIVVYSGIIPVAQNEAALAAVLGHEMAHATSRHGAQRVLQQNLAQTR